MCYAHCVNVYLERELWRREASIDQTIQSARDEMTKCERNLRATVGKVCNVVVVLEPLIGSQLALRNCCK